MESGFETVSVFVRDICWNKLKEVKHKIILMQMNYLGLTPLLSCGRSDL